MTVCDICGTATPVGDGYVLTSAEVSASERYWRNQLPKYRPMILGLDNLEAKEKYLVERVVKCASDPTDWLVCEPCGQLFSFDRPEARHSALRGVKRASEGSADVQAALEAARPVIHHLCSTPVEPGLSSEKTRKYWQCGACGTFYPKGEEREMIERSLQACLDVAGGVTCSVCRTRYEVADVYSGKFDMREDDDVIDRMVAEPHNVSFNKAAKTWSYKGRAIRGAATTASAQAAESRRWWRFWRGFR